MYKNKENLYIWLFYISKYQVTNQSINNFYISLSFELKKLDLDFFSSITFEEDNFIELVSYDNDSVNNDND